MGKFMYTNNHQWNKLDWHQKICLNHWSNHDFIKIIYSIFYKLFLIKRTLKCIYDLKVNIDGNSIIISYALFPHRASNIDDKRQLTQIVFKFPAWLSYDLSGGGCCWCSRYRAHFINTQMLVLIFNKSVRFIFLLLLLF